VCKGGLRRARLTNDEDMDELEEPARNELSELGVPIVLPCQIVEPPLDRMAGESG
jgi:hypothetical protein